MKTKFTLLSLLLLFCIPSVYGQSNASALLAETMRQYQARYRVLNNGDEYTWPSVFNCRYSGMPAPANPSDSYFSEEVHDPERLAELTQSLLDKVSDYYFLRNFVSNYDELMTGNSKQGPSIYSAGILEINELGDVNTSNAVSILVKIRRALEKLNYIILYETLNDESIKVGAGYEGPGRECNQAAALSGSCTDPYDGETNDFYEWQNGWLNYPFRKPHSYNHGDIVYNHTGNVSTGFTLTDPKIGFHEYESNGFPYEPCVYDGIISVVGGVIRVMCLPSTSFSKITIVKGEILVKPLRAPLDLRKTEGEVEL